MKREQILRKYPSQDEAYMTRAMELARQGLGSVSPNPAVGCLLVQDEKVIGEGYHQTYGGAHAEIEAIRHAGDRARGATAYVTLEPCAVAFEGKNTPPCTDALIKAGIRRVVVAARDPNPRVNGRGIQQLRSHGIEVTEGILAREGTQLIRGFAKWILTGRPFIILKVARTSDNFVAVRDQEGLWFTSRESRTWVHRLRAEVDGVLVGRKTVERDDPQLTVREVPGRNPQRLVLDTHLRLSPDLGIFRDGAAPTLVFTTEGDSHKTQWGERIRISPSADGVDLGEMVDVLGKRGITSLLVEGGPTVHRSFLKAGYVDEIVMFTAQTNAGQDVRQRPELMNVIKIPKDWTVITETKLAGDRLTVAQTPERNQSAFKHPQKTNLTGSST